MKWSDEQSQNPVKIEKHDGRFYAVNECGDRLSLGKANRSLAVLWCRRNGCRPIPSTWQLFNKCGYKKN